MSPPQLAALVELVRDWLHRYGLGAHDVWGPAQIDRDRNPGRGFPRARLRALVSRGGLERRPEFENLNDIGLVRGGLEPPT